MTTTRNITIEAALDEAKQAYTDRNPASLAHHQAATGAMPGGNTRTVLYYDPFPITFARGAGARLWDIDGHEYVDFLGEFTAGIAGHSHPAIRRAVEKAMDSGISLGGHNTFEPRFAALVQQRFPSMELVRFTNSGTEANMLAISTAIACTGRKKVLVFRNGYHGAVFMFSPGANINAPFDYIYGSYNDIAATQAEIEANAADLAAVILEPMLGGGGCISAELPFLQMLRDTTAKHGIVLIFDEVMTSRLSPGGLQAVLGITPDLTTLGKYIGGGMSFGAFGGRADLMARFDPRSPNALPHAGTFNNNVLTMSAGIAALTEVYTPEAANALNAMGEDLRSRLNAVAERHGVAMQFTGRGSMLAVHMTRTPIRSPADAAKGNAKTRDLFFFDLQKAGNWIARRGMMVLSLPLTPADIDSLVDAVEEFATSRAHLLQ
ncbi:aspartate aminotransferase family protein [Limobrevibacterium gyesilva]|uniref:Aminotransferase class III-fold pyridoxal phosphate-dependent enzyme n=1 Tax=Limobrevibacterium gyesilva TaxID=2991712 RepID=A0AA41YUD3_9PROT|nr:aminotransferase class III-fold pyridoxal phosphate-dependent enzyme [Limobrevibacterium gyesilva]MCW3476665.1 aminotransferase class III-fold pyridoxal phosphate-dependent enzyme [Limobrevibacterium gyesilva]